MGLKYVDVYIVIAEPSKNTLTLLYNTLDNKIVDKFLIQ